MYQAVAFLVGAITVGLIVIVSSRRHPGVQRDGHAVAGQARTKVRAIAAEEERSEYDDDLDIMMQYLLFPFPSSMFFPRALAAFGRLHAKARTRDHQPRSFHFVMIKPTH